MDHGQTGNLTGRPGALKRRRRAGLLAKLALLAGSVAFTLLVLEIGMRLAGLEPQTATVLSTYFEFNDQTGWRGKPLAACRFTTTNFDVHISHDADGYRRSGLSAAIADDAGAESPVVWVLGDSGTWGWGVEDGRTYVDLLNRHSKDGTRFRNLGHCGYSSVQEYLLLKDLFAAGRKPDLVLILYCGNDLAENLDDRDQDPPRAYVRFVNGVPEIANYPTSRARSWGLMTWLKNHSLLVNHVHYYAVRAKRTVREWRGVDHQSVLAKGKPAASAAAPRGAAGGAEGFHDPRCTPEQHAALRYVYGLMRDLCREHGVGLGIVSEFSVQPVLRQTCREVGIPLLDLSAVYARHASGPEGNRPISFATDPHYNELGHRLIAEGIERELALRGAELRQWPKATARGR